MRIKTVADLRKFLETVTDESASIQIFTPYSCESGDINYGCIAGQLWPEVEMDYTASYTIYPDYCGPSIEMPAELNISFGDWPDCNDR